MPSMPTDSKTYGHMDPSVGLRWPVAERYDVREEIQRGLTDRQVHRLVAVGETRSEWFPAFDADLASSVAALSEAPDEAIVEWVDSRGYLGIHRTLAEAQGETIEEIRESTAHLAACRRLLTALIERPSDDELRHLATEAAGHLVDARLVAVGAGLRPDNEPVRPGVGADIQALRALGTALVWPLQRWTWMLPSVWATQRKMGIEPRMIGSGPIGVAYLQTIQAASALVLDQKLGLERIDWRQTPRRCAGCERMFVPRQVDQLYHDKPCGVAARKRNQRKRAKERADV
jgi:hypothetical protein